MHCVWLSYKKVLVCVRPGTFLSGENVNSSVEKKKKKIVSVKMVNLKDIQKEKKQ